jgi:hypothetical protein
VCGYASYSANHQSLRWVSDAWFIIERQRDLDWDLLLDSARHSHLVEPLAVTLGYLAEDLNAEIPSSFLHRLFAAVSKGGGIGRDLALQSARSAPRGGLRNVLQRTESWRGRASIFKSLLFPSPGYLIWGQHIRRRWLLPFYYAYRPLRYLWLRVWNSLKGFHPRKVVS